MSGQSNGENAIILCSVGLSNSSSESVVGELRLIEDDTVLIERSEELDPKQELIDGPDETRVDGFTIPHEELPSDSGQYSVKMRVNDGAWQEVSTSDWDGDTIMVRGEVEDQDTGNGNSPDIRIMYSYQGSECAE
ncbi:hypothetical protein [Saliphagus infecundisoli]|uniref:hypothetical protein n=1 Tax=Saliphagus infecundisoli TaxID=1849069 RepID=UPI001CD56777|nr:hypothetical protein [Saliphagus infecundisoli]